MYTDQVKEVLDSKNFMIFFSHNGLNDVPNIFVPRSAGPRRTIFSGLGLKLHSIGNN